MASPCVICSEPCGRKLSKSFPDVNTTSRNDYCRALGVDPVIFAHIKTRRYLCFKHFDNDDCEEVDGKTVLSRGAYPKELTEREKNFLICNPPVARLRKPGSRL
uniref:THAP-type domain-containing protein n=1 Tax=Panagrolaimus superbus TaxID=310955 RepID=A0A914Y3H3_9BILA